MGPDMRSFPRTTLCIDGAMLAVDPPFPVLHVICKPRPIMHELVDELHANIKLSLVAVDGPRVSAATSTKQWRWQWRWRWQQRQQ